MRKYADYEYKQKEFTGRIENYEKMWIWRIFGPNGYYASSNEQGVAFTRKKDCKIELMEEIALLRIKRKMIKLN